MKRLLSILLFMTVFIAGCSNDDDPADTEPVDDSRFEITVNGSTVSLLPHRALNHGTVRGDGDFFEILAGYGYGIDSEHQSQLYMRFRVGTGVIYVEQDSYSDEAGDHFVYENYPNFPANYFQVNVISVDEVNHTIKMTFSGKLYLDRNNLNSESIDISGDINVPYEVQEDVPTIWLGSYEQYCNAKINGTPWVATIEDPYSVFTSSDAFKIETHLNTGEALGSYPFTDATGNYMRFWKFNPDTLSWETFDISGTITLTYKEWHGGGAYTYVGTFSFTAVNPNNPTDVYTVTEGEFKSYQSP